MKPSDRRKTSLFRGVFLLALALTLVSCGLKSNPVPKGSAPPGLTRDLTVEKTGEGALLKWRLAGEVGAKQSFRVERAELDLVCPTCPLKYDLIATPDRAAVTDPERSGAYRLMDRGVKTGSAYRWHISACNDRGRCGEASTVDQ